MSRQVSNEFSFLCYIREHSNRTVPITEQQWASEICRRNWTDQSTPTTMDSAVVQQILGTECRLPVGTEDWQFAVLARTGIVNPK